MAQPPLPAAQPGLVADNIPTVPLPSPLPPIQSHPLHPPKVQRFDAASIRPSAPARPRYPPCTQRCVHCFFDYIYTYIRPRFKSRTNARVIGHGELCFFRLSGRSACSPGLRESAMDMPQTDSLPQPPTWAVSETDCQTLGEACCL
ncbi:uncharacterized protein SETTUDRAFT_39062 [Exserohilum turcica Et28A]|uniref:Uncharacterized protein n=1 Tax=Exserohilum turcicum (strain 28A) TaxID=671987 RepID=R0ISW5_EXST2|nr:uncharacterized protein SETTUDRAFT_39062 [Exserohilum turcica Et28A]EOA87935.1 hypothetical protein SETTUDRAFT_39062 [Exserohilum turcica Et28A]